MRLQSIPSCRQIRYTSTGEVCTLSATIPTYTLTADKGSVYTTTFTRLVDPTANRLENFWWHVWGSELRHLPGPVLARMFEQISNGPTFVRLRSTANRYEGPSLPVCGQPLSYIFTGDEAF